MDELILSMVEHYLKESFRVNGIEGTEELFKKVYANSPKILEIYQKVYDKIVKGKEE